MPKDHRLAQHRLGRPLWTIPLACAAAMLAPIAAACPAFAQDAAAKSSIRDIVYHALNADIIVQAVIVGLIIASLVTWTVFVAKTFELRGARKAVRRGIRVLTGTATLSQAYEQLRQDENPVGELVQAAGREVRLSDNRKSDGLKERIALQLERIEVAASRRISRGTGVLATIGSTAPFVGLFGTVWGIMDSFIGISNAHTTNLAVVAPGIAEALFATALGLVAAIPAVMIYNVLTRSTAHYRALLGDASALVMTIVSRDLDRAKLAPITQAAE
jgi:biopolymer transport protein ExbB